MKSTKQKPIPYAFDSAGNTFLPKRGQNGMELYCPDCQQAIEPRTQGKKVSPYYAHKREHSPDCCFGGGGESPEHRQACHAVKALLLRMMESASPICIDLLCDTHSQGNKINWIPSNGTVLVDKPIPGELFAKGYRPDVVLIANSGEIDLWIEILHTHPVPSEKADALNGMGIRWIEIDLRDANLEALVWAAGRHGGFGKLNCCITAEERAARLAKMPTKETRIPQRHQSDPNNPFAPDSPTLRALVADFNESNNLETSSEDPRDFVDVDRHMWSSNEGDFPADVISDYNQKFGGVDWGLIFEISTKAKSEAVGISTAILRIQWLTPLNAKPNRNDVPRFLRDTGLIKPVVSTSRPLPVDLDGLRWSAYTPDSWSCQELVDSHSTIWGKWRWKDILDEALSCRSRNEDVEIAIRRIMVEHGFSRSNGVVKRFLVLAKILAAITSDGRERHVGFCPLNGLTPWCRDVNEVRICVDCAHRGNKLCCLTEGEAMATHTS